MEKVLILVAFSNFLWYNKLVRNTALPAPLSAAKPSGARAAVSLWTDPLSCPGFD